MLNYIWLALILIGVSVAVWTDINDLTTNKYHNGVEYQVSLNIAASEIPLVAARHYSCIATIDSQSYQEMNVTNVHQTYPITQRVELIVVNESLGVLHIFTNEKTPSTWKEIYRIQKNSEYLLAHVRWENSSTSVITGWISFDPVKFVKMNSVTNDGIIKYAKTAVELAIGLIGIMALWLGIMKIADQSGLVSKLASALKPITTRLFPDVPPDHPAMGAMLMNISANMLGLMNAATPLGLKAMEELNKLNRKLGTATDAMCTFLVINTSNVQIIPATVIAIRAAAGAANPTDILGPVLVATTVNTIIGVITVKLLARLRVFRKQIE